MLVLVLLLVIVLVIVLVIEAIRASSIHLSITSTSTVRHGGLSTSTTKSMDKIMHRILHPSAFEEFLIDVRRWLLIRLAIGEARPEFQRLVIESRQFERVLFIFRLRARAPSATAD
ncbi:MAG: hypothetical protein DWH99_07250 [Planctomycetota bacterium]|nr:MAG: hypothetical protein DWH99_07250 [Planctomycetota bacterium]